ncbi:MAG: ABC transporter permease [Lachnospiraceae bacterium]|nr:ABC transporter permease [Lachnospiraceae bacterium]
MTGRITKRIAELLVLLIVLSILTFLLMYLAPGDPAQKRLSSQGVAVTKEMLDAERERMGLARPFFVRYGEWAWGVIRGDFGLSLKDDMPVAPKLREGLSNTIVLASASLILSLVFAIPLGILSAVKKNSIFDHTVRILSFIGNSLPNFLISVILMYFFCIWLDLFPIIASGSIQGLFLPALSLAIPMCARFTRQIRAEIQKELERDYVTGLRARGVKESDVLIKNVLYNCMGHIFTIIALQIGTLMGGSVVIETIFRWPGIGKLVMDSITARDYPVIMGFVLIMGTIYVAVNLLSDIICQVIDPRVENE